MSQFCGLFDDIPGISADCFDNDNFNSVVYLLSHCHSDHMKGLNDYFFNHLIFKNRYLYCSPISKQILLNHKKITINDPNRIKTLEMHSPEVISYWFEGKEMSVTVTTIPSGHCPGSVMFVLEKDNISNLYTGDFRYNVEDLKKLKVFKTFDGYSKKSFTKVYVDTTFFSELYPKFPSREESVQEIIRIAKEWLDKDERNVISIESSAFFGSEYIYKNLVRTFNSKIHVKDFLYKTYSEFIGGYVTNDNTVRIHDCNAKSCKSKILFCNKTIAAEHVLVIVPSAMIWKNWDSTSISRWNPDRTNVKNVCYSAHSSFEELKAFIQHVQCEKIIPFVTPVGSDMEKTLKLIDSFKKTVVDCSPSTDFKLTERPKRFWNDKFKSQYLSSDDDD